MADQIPEPPERDTRYRSLSNFYLTDPRRITSPERDLGVSWKVGLHGPSYRAAWVPETGELYATRFGASREEGEVHVLGRASDEELEEALEGWADVCPQPDSMTWLRHRASSLAAPEEARSISRDRRDLARATRRAQQAKATLTGTDRRARITPADGVGVGGRHARDRSAGTAARPVASSDTGASSPAAASAARRRINTKLVALVAATAGITAPATALLMELSAA